ncbi:phosphotransferase enzyme family protein [Luteibacter sahnii]|uniref:phosphotransferase enzyme family protein n=1 Tax=Luteibacter sahnii TaxID=3021977 RepID=UPI002A6B0721|nr:phosphotransferase [Luteibacter sp. PPL193]MDY1547603.1 phosphotransferase [Luteibacter sp. PPL193]
MARNRMPAFPESYDLRPLDEGRRVTDRVVRWRTPSGDVAVKTYTGEHRARGRQEARLIAFLGTPADPRFRVQSVVATRRGEPFADTEDASVLVTRWESGASRRYDAFTRREWSSLGSSLAALHRRLDEWTAPPVDTLSARLARIDIDAERARLQMPGGALPDAPGLDAARVEDYLACCRDLLVRCHPGAVGAFPAADPQRPIHNDYNQFNYLFDDTLPPVIIDWEASIGAPREFEVVRCLNHLPLQAPASAQAFIEGYLAVRSLRGAHMRWAVDVACLMHATKHWVLDGWLDGREGFAERLTGAMAMTALFAGGRDAMADFYLRHAGGAA